MFTGSLRSWPVAVRSPVERKLRRRNSSGVRPMVWAILSMWRSRAKMLCGAPKPRKAPWGGMLVAMALERMVRCGPVVGAGGVDGGAGEDDGGEGGVGSAVKGDFDFAGEEFAVFADGGAVAGAGGVALGGGGHVFGAVVADFYGVAGLHGEESGVAADDGGEVFFAAEGSAGFDLDDAAFFGGEVED